MESLISGNNTTQDVGSVTLPKKRNSQQLDPTLEKTNSLFINHHSKKQLKDTDVNKTLSHTPTIVIDLSFEAHLSDKWLHSLSAQIVCAYSSIKRSSLPLKLVLASLISTSKTDKILRTHNGYEFWKLSKEEKPVQELHKKEEMVYLSPESSNALSEIDLNKVYVIGGIVDHNNLKGLSLKRAEELGIPTAKFAIKEVIPTFCNQSLNINHVVDIIISAAETNDLKRAIALHVPARYQHSKPRWPSRNPKIYSKST